MGIVATSLLGRAAQAAVSLYGIGVAGASSQEGKAGTSGGISAIAARCYGKPTPRPDVAAAAATSPSFAEVDQLSAVRGLSHVITERRCTFVAEDRPLVGPDDDQGAHPASGRAASSAFGPRSGGSTGAVERGTPAPDARATEALALTCPAGAISMGVLLFIATSTAVGTTAGGYGVAVIPTPAHEAISLHEDQAAKDTGLNARISVRSRFSAGSRHEAGRHPQYAIRQRARASSLRTARRMKSSGDPLGHYSRRHGNHAACGTRVSSRHMRHCFLLSRYTFPCQVAPYEYILTICG